MIHSDSMWLGGISITIRDESEISLLASRWYLKLSFSNDLNSACTS